MYDDIQCKAGVYLSVPCEINKPEGNPVYNFCFSGIEK